MCRYLNGRILLPVFLTYLPTQASSFLSPPLHRHHQNFHPHFTIAPHLFSHPWFLDDPLDSEPATSQQIFNPTKTRNLGLHWL